MVKGKPSVSIKQLYEAQNHLFQVTYHRWLEDVLFTFNWWFLVTLAIVPLLIWWRIVDKNRLIEISVVGLLVWATATFLDLIGVSFSLWAYGYQVIQMLEPMGPINMSVLPTMYMLVYQWFPKWKEYVAVQIIMAGASSFVAAPLFVWLKIYHLNEWKYVYSFPIYIAIGIVVKGMVQKMISIQSKH